MTVEAACYGLGKAVSSVYALRRRPEGASFALAWDAANPLARGRIADRMLSRALDGQVDRVVKPNGEVVERHRFDNRLALHMLARLDRQAEAAAGADGAARLVAQDFDAFVDLVRRDAAPARAALFLVHAGQTGATTSAIWSPTAATNGPPSNGAAPSAPDWSRSRPRPRSRPPRKPRTSLHFLHFTSPSRCGGTTRRTNGAPDSRRPTALTGSRATSRAAL